MVGTARRKPCALNGPRRLQRSPSDRDQSVITQSARRDERGRLLVLAVGAGGRRGLPHQGAHDHDTAGSVRACPPPRASCSCGRGVRRAVRGGRCAAGGSPGAADRMRSGPRFWSMARLRRSSLARTLRGSPSRTRLAHPPLPPAPPAQAGLPPLSAWRRASDGCRRCAAVARVLRPTSTLPLQSCRVSRRGNPVRMCARARTQPTGARIRAEWRQPPASKYRRTMSL